MNSTTINFCPSIGNCKPNKFDIYIKNKKVPWASHSACPMPIQTVALKSLPTLYATGYGY